MWIAIAALLGLVLGAGGMLALVQMKRKRDQRTIEDAEEQAKQIINDAIKSAENKKREALLEAKEEIHASRTEYEREVKERRAELSKQERRLQQKEEALDKKTENIERKNDQITKKLSELDAAKEEVALVKRGQLEMLEKISGYTVDEAKAYLIKNVETECTHEVAMKIKEIEARFKEESDEKAKEVISLAIQRCAADHVAEATVSVQYLFTLKYSFSKSK